MIYGLYQSATGVLTSAYRQDVIANNLANAETVGFKRDQALFKERLTAAQLGRMSPQRHSNELLEGLGGGLSFAPTFTDMSQGELEATGNPLDLAIQGRGFFAVRDGGQTRLTRDGRLQADAQGFLILANGGQQVLDANQRPIQLDPRLPVQINREGGITQAGKPVGQVGLFDVPDHRLLKKHGELLMSYPNAAQVRPVAGLVRSETLERANVDPASELTQLLETQRQLEANANLIRYQDQTLSRLVNEVGKIG